jgi:nicotinamidase-related amidase
MEFFIRLFRPAPKDEQLWDMLRENCMHLAIDNQFDQVVRTITRDFQPRFQKLSARHVAFTNEIAHAVPTVNVNVAVLPPVQPYLEPTEEGEKLRAERVMQIDYDPATMTAVRNEKDGTWWDCLNPEALDQRIHIKTSDDVFADENVNKMAFLKAVKKERTERFLLSGFATRQCVGRTAFGAVREGFGVIVDPEQSYNWYEMRSANVQDIFRYHSRKTIVTEPGQIADVVKKFAPNTLILTS